MSAQFVANNYNYGSDPIEVTCFHCKSVVVTRTIESTNAMCCFLYTLNIDAHSVMSYLEYTSQVNVGVRNLIESTEVV
ncbi:hypothetical protein HA402_011565 [Bradysia odoriphaga]|nr:hypothetical protein HA402_011565 [Bradysia odoriphaga]